MHAAFEGDGEEVQREWVRFTQRVDKRLEEALRATVKRSLQVGRRGGRGCCWLQSICSLQNECCLKPLTSINTHHKT
jgi:hypothetical protein